MSRLVLHERNRPYVVKAGDQELHLCGCGLSANKQYCDGTHVKTVDEKSDVFVYDTKGGRVKIQSFYQNP